jgi:F-type H+-transporting ATPase subunit gamma
MSLLKSRARLRSIRSLNSILSALQVVTVVRMKRIRERFAVTEEYLKPVKDVLAGRVQPKKLDKKVLVVITGNRGLCGNFNSQVLGKAKAFLAKEEGFTVAALGKRAANYFRDRLVLSEFEVLERPTFGKIKKLWGKIAGLDAEVYVAYNAYKSTAVQVPTIVRLSPVPEELESGQEPSDYILEPGAARLTEALFAHYLEARFYQLIIASQMGELAARLMVLKSAVDNSKDLINSLVISINKLRQTNITRDLAEIIGSAEALRSKR